MRITGLIAATAIAMVSIACGQTDAGITAAVKTRLAANAAVSAATIDVDTQNKVVTLTGTVDSTLAKAEAVRLARESDGVTDVVDNLQVAPGAGGVGASVERDLERAGEAVVDAAKETGAAAKDGAKAVEESGSGLGQAAKDAGGAVADAAKRAGQATADGAKTVGSATADGAKTVGQATADGAKAVGSATAEGAKTVGAATAEGAKDVGTGFKKIGEGISDAVTPDKK